MNLYTNKTKHTNIFFSDYYSSKNCYDKNAYILFEYYLNNNIESPFNIINDESDLYKLLLKENKTKIISKEKSHNFYHNLYEFLKYAKIIINSSSIYIFFGWWQVVCNLLFF